VHVKPGVSHAPVVAFVHGGAFVRGDKCTNEAIYGNVLNWFAARGYVGINLEYRLAPEATHPEAARDVASAMAWLAAHVANYGGDPAQIHLIGHSAGATHVASYACDPLVGNYAREAASVSLISGRLAADISPENPNAPGVRAYFGDDPGFFAERAPMAYAHLTSKPLMLVYAEFENPLLDIYTLEFAHRVAFAKRRAPRVLRMNRHNHVSVMAHFNSGEEILGHAMIDFFETRS
jgi:acetyl esterase